MRLDLKQHPTPGAPSGFSLVESMLAIAIASVIMGALLPRFTTIVRTFRRDGVTDQIAADVRKVRAQSISTGWQYRIIGFSSGSTNANKGQYRMMGRSSSAIAWPADNAAQLKTATQMAGPWVDIRTMFPGVSLNPANTATHFSVAFDSRGVRIELDATFDPLVIQSQTGSSKSLRITPVGNVEIQ